MPIPRKVAAAPGETEHAIQSFQVRHGGFVPRVRAKVVKMGNDPEKSSVISFIEQQNTGLDGFQDPEWEYWVCH